MTEDEQTIRGQIERWAEAVHRGDLDTVLADRAEDVVMFDVPPPQDGVRGIEAYRRTWPAFFEWQASGALFEIVSLEVTAGADVAFAHALLRCAMPADLADHPDARLRITFGLRKEDGRWLVTHEHHSFPDSGRTGTGEDEVRAVHEEWFAATAAGDLDRITAHIAEDVVSYEHEVPLRYEGVEQVREVCRRGLEVAPGKVGWDVPDLRILVDGELAVAWGLNRVSVPDGESWSRGTRVFRRGRGGWTLAHQHVSFPFDPRTGAAATDLTP